MRVKDVFAEDFCNYKLPSMFIASAICDWKCGKELCQNSDLAKTDNKIIGDDVIFEMYRNNDITKAIVIGGLEPMLQIDEVVHLISYFRDNGDDSLFVIYTGYNEDEVIAKVERLKPLCNIVIKYGRYIPNQHPHYDDVLGVNLASDNQFAIQIS